MNKIKTAEEGFTVVELLVMLAVLVIIFTTFASSFSTIQTINKKASDVNIANQIAFAKVQEYENKPYSSLTNTTPQGSLVQVEDFTSSLPSTLQKPRSAIVYINTVSSSLKQVVVDVEYGDSTAQKHIVEYTDFIQKNGL